MPSDLIVNIDRIETHFKLDRALLCVGCETVFQDRFGVCPACTGSSVLALANVLGQTETKEIVYG